MKPTREATHNQEIEWQFDTDDLGAVERWLRERAAAGDWQFHFGAPKEQTDIYYDTPDWRIFRAGYVLRVRQAEGSSAEATLKSFGTRQDGLRRRREISERLAGDAVTGDPIAHLIRAPGPVGQRVRALLGKHAARMLRRLFESRTRRQTVEAQRGAGLTHQKF